MTSNTQTVPVAGPSQPTLKFKTRPARTFLRPSGKSHMASCVMGAPFLRRLVTKNLKFSERLPTNLIFLVVSDGFLAELWHNWMLSIVCRPSWEPHRRFCDQHDYETCKQDWLQGELV